MLAQVEGQLQYKEPGRVFLKSGPFVLEILTPFSLSERLPPPGQDCRLYVCLRIRNEIPELYGFLSAEARELFSRLQEVSRLGPRLALNILGVFEPQEFLEIIAQNDVESLSKVPGIGPRRAERLCVELRSRLGIRKPLTSPLFNEALSALLNLGFSPDEARMALEKSFQEGKDLSEIIKEALKRLSTS